MADTAITADTLKQMISVEDQLLNNYSTKQLYEASLKITESAVTEEDFADAEMWSNAAAASKMRDKRAAAPTKTQRRGDGSTVGGTGGMEGIKKSLSAVSPKLSEKEVMEGRIANAEETGKPSSALAESIANLKLEQKTMDLQARNAQAKLDHDREVRKYENLSDRELLKNKAEALLYTEKNDQMAEYKRLEDEKRVIMEDAKTTFEAKQGQIRQAMLTFQTRNPYKTVFQSSFGIAAAFIGAIRQSLFGGENEAAKYMSEKVDAMVRQNQTEYSMMNQELAEEEILFKNIISATGNQVDDIYQQKQLFLDDIGNALEIINEKYSVNMSAEQLQAAKDTLMDVQSKNENEYQQSVVDKDIEILEGEAALKKRTQKSSLQIRQEAMLDDPTIKSNISPEFQESYFAALSELAAVNKVVETAIDLVMADLPKGERDTLWKQYITLGFAALPDIFGHLSEILGDENRSWKTVTARMLEGEQKSIAFQIARSEQGGSRITQKDFEYTYERIAQYFSSPRKFQEQAARTINMAVEKIDRLNSLANSRNAYSNQGSLALNATQKWLLLQNSSPTYLGPYVADQLRKRLNSALRNKSIQGDALDTPLTDEQLLEIQELYPEGATSTVGEEALRFRMGDAYNAPYDKSLGILSGAAAIARGAWNILTPRGEAESGKKMSIVHQQPK